MDTLHITAEFVELADIIIKIAHFYIRWCPNCFRFYDCFFAVAKTGYKL
jgi:hypothetical protein